MKAINYEIWQVKNGYDYRNYRYAPLSELKLMGLGVDRENYDCTASGRIVTDNLYHIIGLYDGSNGEPEGFDPNVNRFIGVGDVVIADGTAYFIDRAGFEVISHF